MSRRGRLPLTTGPMPAVLEAQSPTSSVVSGMNRAGSRDLDGPPPIILGQPVVAMPQHPTYQSEDDQQSDVYHPPPPSHRQTIGATVAGPPVVAPEGQFVQRDPDHYRPEYGTSAGTRRSSPSARHPPSAVAGADRTGSKKLKVKPSSVPIAVIDDSGELARLKTKNRSLKVALEDHIARLELLKTDNDNLIQRLGDARKERERVEQELERERREFRDKLREIDKSRKSGGPESRVLEQAIAEKAELTDALRRAELELAREREQHKRLQLQTASAGAGGGVKHEMLDNELRRVKAENERLSSELRREMMKADELNSELNLLRDSTVSVSRERELEAKLEKAQRDAEYNQRKLQDALSENERMRKNRVPIEVEKDLSGQVVSLTANIKGKERQIDDLNEQLRKMTNVKNDLEKLNSDLQESLSELRRDVQRSKADVNDIRDSNEREMARLRAENERMKTSKDYEQYRTPRRFPSDSDIHISASASPRRSVPVHLSESQTAPLQELIKDQESHIADLRREVESLRLAVTDYQKENDRLRVAAEDETVTREKFHDIASAHRRLLDENARLLVLLDKCQQKEARALTDKTDVVRNLSDAKRQVDKGHKRIAQLEQWLDEIYNNNNFDVIPKRNGSYAHGHVCRGAYPTPPQFPMALTERRRAEIRRLLDESRLTAPTTSSSCKTARVGCKTDRL